jgi:hypothetical protein
MENVQHPIDINLVWIRDSIFNRLWFTVDESRSTNLADNEYAVRAARFYFSKFQGVLGFALQILLADSLKGFEPQPKTKRLHQKHRERQELKYSVFTHFCRSWIPGISLSKTKLTTYNLFGSITHH